LTIEPTTFSTVSATWVQPNAACSPTSTGPTSAAFWVGLGGNSNYSNALEQTGTEADCTSTGARYFAWYELVPAPSVKLGLDVSPGDTMSASVSVRGKRVAIVMRNRSQGTSSSKTLTMGAPGTSSAEWIVEAPSVCDASDQCRSQSLTNFGTVTFSSATAHSGDATGPISDSSWTATPIELRTHGGPGDFSGGGQFAPEQNEALPSTLTETGTTFTVTWRSDQRSSLG
jgi:Peptidase A4 family